MERINLVTNIFGVVIVILLIWVVNRRLDPEHHAALLISSKGCPPAENAVHEFLAKRRPTCWEAKSLLKKINRIRAEWVVATHKSMKEG